jgi:hypothetical protein
MRRGAHRYREPDENPRWGFALITTLALIIGAATAVVVTRG